VYTTLPTLCGADVDLAAARIRPYARRTPLWRTDVGGRPVVLKLENLQRSGSFKLRGALNGMLARPAGVPVVAASGGNHGLGVATAAGLLGVPATVYVPDSAPQAKARRIQAAGARLVRVGSTFAEAADRAQQDAARTGQRFLHAYDDPDVIAGQGTVAAEVVADASDVDAFVVAAGGGGLAAGTALAAGERLTVIVEPERCNAVHAALAAGQPVDAPVASIAASALGASRAGMLPLEVLSTHRVASVLVTDAQILAAQALLWEEFRLAVEPAAAVPLAALLAADAPGKLPCLVVCGGNV
jgi:threonine dehydratase